LLKPSEVCALFAVAREVMAIVAEAHGQADSGDVDNVENPWVVKNTFIDIDQQGNSLNERSRVLRKTRTDPDDEVRFLLPRLPCMAPPTCAPHAEVPAEFEAEAEAEDEVEAEADGEVERGDAISERDLEYASSESTNDCSSVGHADGEPCIHTPELTPRRPESPWGSGATPSSSSDTPPRYYSQAELQQHLEEHHRMASAAWLPQWVPTTPTTRVPATPTTRTAVEVAAASVTQSPAGPPDQITFTLRLASKGDLGVVWRSAEATSDGKLMVDRVITGSTLEAWNRRCSEGGSAAGKRVAPGAVLLAVNDQTTRQAMLDECKEKMLLKLTFKPVAAESVLKASTAPFQSARTLCTGLMNASSERRIPIQIHGHL